MATTEDGGRVREAALTVLRERLEGTKTLTFPDDVEAVLEAVVLEARSGERPLHSIADAAGLFDD